MCAVCATLANAIISTWILDFITICSLCYSCCLSMYALALYYHTCLFNNNGTNTNECHNVPCVCCKIHNICVVRVYILRSVCGACADMHKKNLIPVDRDACCNLRIFYMYSYRFTTEPTAMRSRTERRAQSRRCYITRQYKNSVSVFVSDTTRCVHDTETWRVSFQFALCVISRTMILLFLSCSQSVSQSVTCNATNAQRLATDGDAFAMARGCRLHALTCGDVIKQRESRQLVPSNTI